MATVKRFSGDYTFAANDGGSLTMDAEVVIGGNLAVLGNSSVISTTDFAVSDNTITLNVGEVGAGITLGSAGLEIDRGSLANVFITYSEPVDMWQISNDGSTFYNIVATTSGVTELLDDTSPELGATLDTLLNPITSSAGNVIIDSNVAIVYNDSPSASTANVAILNAGAIGGGGTGVSVTNSTEINEELISKKKAIGLSFLL